MTLPEPSPLAEKRRKSAHGDEQDIHAEEEGVLSKPAVVRVHQDLGDKKIRKTQGSQENGNVVEDSNHSRLDLSKGKAVGEKAGEEHSRRGSRVPL